MHAFVTAENNAKEAESKARSVMILLSERGGGCCHWADAAAVLNIVITEHLVSSVCMQRLQSNSKLMITVPSAHSSQFFIFCWSLRAISWHDLGSSCLTYVMWPPLSIVHLSSLTIPQYQMLYRLVFMPVAVAGKCKVLLPWLFYSMCYNYLH